MSEEFRYLADRLRREGFGTAADITSIHEENLRGRGLIPPRLKPERGVVELTRRSRTPFHDPQLLMRKSLGVVNGYTGYEISEDLLIGKGRRRHIVTTRHLIVSLMREVGNLGSPSIGAILGRDHSTILHSFNRVEQMRTDPIFSRSLDVLTERLREELKESNT